ncbi:MAG: NADH:ubiquinone oxidoreductase subunit NDUFA12 [Pseudomonadota bacterium]
MISRIFTWWNTTTFGTSLTLWAKGAKLVGRDEQGNRYFEEKKATGPNGKTRRWVIYHGIAEASRVPPDWHGWLHHTYDTPPTEAPFAPMDWERQHLPNMTGTPMAYRPKGSLELSGKGGSVNSDYEAWSPDGGEHPK